MMSSRRASYTTIILLSLSVLSLNTHIVPISGCSLVYPQHLVEDLRVTTVEDILEFKIVYRNGSLVHHLQFDFKNDKFIDFDSTISKPDNDTTGNWWWSTFYGPDCSTNPISYNLEGNVLTTDTYRFFSEFQVDQENDILYQLTVNWKETLELHRYEVVNDSMTQNDWEYNVSDIPDLLNTESTQVVIPSLTIPVTFLILLSIGQLSRKKECHFSEY